SRPVGLAALAIFLLLLVALPVWRNLGASQGLALFEAFYRSGALVFGGGHVVLPLLREAVVAPGWVSDDVFLAGYGAAQAGLGAALYRPVWTSSVETPADFGLALVGFVLLNVWRAPPLLVVVIGALGGVALAQLRA